LKLGLGAVGSNFFGHNYRIIGTYQQMNAPIKGDQMMEIFIPLSLLVVWIILQAWVLPRFGVKT